MHDITFNQKYEYNSSELLTLYRKHLIDIVLLIINKKFIGYLVTIDNNNLTILEYFAIKEDYRSYGLGSKILKLYLSTNRTFILECNDGLIGFYKKLGFITTGKQLEYDGDIFNVMIYNNSVSINTLLETICKINNYVLKNK